MFSDCQTSKPPSTSWIRQSCRSFDAQKIRNETDLSLYSCSEFKTKRTCPNAKRNGLCLIFMLMFEAHVHVRTRNETDLAMFMFLFPPKRNRCCLIHVRSSPSAHVHLRTQGSWSPQDLHLRVEVRGLRFSLCSESAPLFALEGLEVGEPPPQVLRHRILP